MTERIGPAERLPCAEQLSAFVLDHGFGAPKIFGYDVESDLARHYRFGETLLLLLTGNLPDERAGRAFEIAMTFWAAVSVADPPAHAAVLARTCATEISSLVVVSAVAAAEEARHIVDEHAALLESSDSIPERFKVDPADPTVLRLRSALEGTLSVPALDQKPTRSAALISVLAACGVRSREGLIAAISLARIPCSVAEALARPPLELLEYPLRLPPFAYEEP